MTTTPIETSVSHTPGPWRVVQPQADGYWGILAEDGFPVVVVTTVREPADANAHLIAAAPELLAALRVAADEIKDVSKHHALNSWETIGPAIEAAIAKAEGHES